MKYNLQKLQKKINYVKFKIIENSHFSKTPHLASCLSCTDIIMYLYYEIMNINKQNYLSPNRDRFILSKGHAAPALFQILAIKGFYNENKLKNYGKDGSLFGEHPPKPNLLPGIEASTGSLGHGLPIAVGIALGAKIQKKTFKTYVLVGDGECGEGTIWESAIIAAANDLDNLFVIIDYNKWQATNKINEVMGSIDFKKKWKSFNWDVYNVKGNDISKIDKVFNNLKKNKKPKLILSDSIKGHGVKFMQNDNNWHYRIPTIDEVNKSKKILLG